MTSSIFRPRMSRAWPEPSTHLTASTMLVLPEPLGPTMAVTPPSNWISVCRAKVLKPSNCRDLRNKLAGRLADVGVNRPSSTRRGASVDRFAELAAPSFRHLGLALLGRGVKRHHLGWRRLRHRRCAFALPARSPPGSRFG